ncbi:hypothetical protein BHE74_00042161 [Ensete ventricosum]|nr:hypothetical protein BHE74_00042161 [Ensete ventricosum]
MGTIVARGLRGWRRLAGGDDSRARERGQHAGEDSGRLTLVSFYHSQAPCIIFIDEIDAVGSTRKQWEGHAKKTLHQLLVEMDGFEQNEGILLMAATNLPDILDPALTRPGRFDLHVSYITLSRYHPYWAVCTGPPADRYADRLLLGEEENLDLEISSPDSLLARDFFSPHEEKERGDIVVPSPDVQGRQEILELYLQDKPLADDIDVNVIARGTPGFTGAVEGVDKITAAHLEFAKDRMIMGTERKAMFISEESRKLTAYHESGHAIVALNTDCAHAIHKATIIPRGSALGMVTQLPLQDETSISKRQLLARLDVCMGGRVAEELIFGEESITSGASSDLQTATELAHYMVLFFGLSIIVLVFFSIVLLSISAVWQVSTCGMSDAIGPVSVKERPGSELQSRIDAEVCFLY